MFSHSLKIHLHKPCSKQPLNCHHRTANGLRFPPANSPTSIHNVSPCRSFVSSCLHPPALSRVTVFYLRPLLARSARSAYRPRADRCRHSNEWRAAARRYDWVTREPSRCNRPGKNRQPPARPPPPPPEPGQARATGGPESMHVLEPSMNGFAQIPRSLNT